MPASTNTARPAATHAPRHHVEMVMGMAVSIDIVDEVAIDVIDAVVQWLHHVDDTYSTYKIDSPISRLGLGHATPEDMSDEVRSVLALCEHIKLDTNGAFDILSVPAPNGSHLDPSGVVKGWSIERAAELLETLGAQNFCINAGGDIAVRGRPEPVARWRVGIRHPDQPMMSAAVVELPERHAIATSATYERGAHIIDPVTGEPTADLASVTIIGPDLTYADAYATAVFVMGVEGLEWLQTHHPDYAGFVITHDDITYSTTTFGQYLVM
jgi:FAD:protein FMN transferase